MFRCDYSRTRWRLKWLMQQWEKWPGEGPAAHSKSFAWSLLCPHSIQPTLIHIPPPFSCSSELPTLTMADQMLWQLWPHSLHLHFSCFRNLRRHACKESTILKPTSVEWLCVFPKTKFRLSLLHHPHCPTGLLDSKGQVCFQGVCCTSELLKRKCFNCPYFGSMVYIHSDKPNNILVLATKWITLETLCWVE